MLKKFTILSTLFSALFSAQNVGINTTTPAATLDVTGKATNTTALDGIIAPRLTGDQLRAKTYTSSQTGALVYVITADSAPAGQTKNVLSGGYYYFDGNFWIPFPGDDWHTTGNNFTTTDNRYLGPFGESRLIFKVNGIPSGFIESGNIVNSSAASHYSTAFGYNTLNPLTSKGFNNSAFGTGVLYQNTTGYSNTALGSSTLGGNFTGNENTAVGTMSLNQNYQGSGNTGAGSYTLEKNVYGSYNTTLGYYAGRYLVDGSNNIFIGTSAEGPGYTTVGATYNDSNTLNIGKTIYGKGINNTSIADDYVGISTTTPNSTMQVNGSFSTAYNTPNSGSYTLTNQDYTVRIYNGSSNIILPDASTCKGRIYILIGSNGISSKSISVSGGLGIYDDVTNSNITSINANQRFQIQSDGSGWIVIGR